MGAKKPEFPFLYVILSYFYLFLSFVLLHEYVIGDPFKSIQSFLVTGYLVACTWAFSHTAEVMNNMIESYREKIGCLTYSVSKGLSVLFYFVTPVVYIYLKFLQKNDN